MSEQETRVVLGDVWEYDERSPALLGERRVVKRHADGALAVFHEGGGYNHNNLEFLRTHARLISRAKPEAKHPERRPGMRFEPADKSGKCTLTRRDPQDPSIWRLKWDSMKFECGIVSDSELADPEKWTLISDAPPATPRGACKAFCGYTYAAILDEQKAKGPLYQAWSRVMAIQRIDESSLPIRERHAWCTQACADAKYPPLSALGEGPVEAAKARWRERNGQLVSAAKAAESAKAPVCLGCRKSPCSSAYILCSGGLASREPVGAQTLTESKLPERIDRRLSHIAAMADDELITWGGR